MQHFRLFIDGEWTDGAAGQAMASQNPATGEDWASFACAAPEDIERAVAAAHRALSDPAWRDLSQSARGKLLYRLADLIEEHAAELGRIETTDSGKLLAETSTQTKYVADYYRYYAGLADKIEGAVLPIDKPDMHVFTRRFPIGVVAAVVPWNAQMFLSATKLGPALAAGCTVVLKASEIAPVPMLEFARLIEAAGFPPGVVSILTGDAENCAIPLTRHPDIDRIAFTGGPEAARHVVRNSAENFAVTTLELGGKSPIIVFEDADLEGASNGLIAGNFGASGQSCVAGSRGLVQRSVFEALVEKIAAKAEAIVVGDPLDTSTSMGPLCTRAQLDRIEATLVHAQEQGARIRFGGKALDRAGHYMAPTLVECRSADTATLKVEMFGPVMSLLPFDTEEEAIALANDSEFGLGSGIFTENLSRAHRVSSRLRAGICWINTYRAISPIAPFGGFNQSGYGREAGMEAVLDYMRTQTTWVNTSAAPMANPFLMR
ncbi:aldehyde dehydrogenase [Roseibium salinum]|uniref:Aldehyde dehydrogenase n=1 Tax=Roseibium salinum TaxID=1604349 RepID=A0ABT3QWG4_9HYPH|nr:aldehyde dehydrogenase [Roseibium sp. DSM 29163]MCX2721273.1 aldehyde dehydrogenase [Roseibium sp. DSM 29163]